MADTDSAAKARYPARLRRSYSPTIPSISSQDMVSSEDQFQKSSSGGQRKRKRKTRELDHVLVQPLAYPRSSYCGLEPRDTPCKESEALDALRRLFHQAYKRDRPEYTFFRLDEFSIYRPRSAIPETSRHELELTSLDRLQNRNGYGELLFDGFLSFGSTKFYVEGVRFVTLAQEGYGDPDPQELPGRLSIQSKLAKAHGVWYELGRPGEEYRRFHQPFLWLAQFTIYFVDYLSTKENVAIRDFRNDFYEWTLGKYGEKPNFGPWHARCRHLRDFATNVHAHIGYLWKECYSIDDDDLGLCRHPVWKEVDPDRLYAIPELPNREQKTIVTPFVYHCFKRMYFSSMLEKRKIRTEGLLERVTKRKAQFNLTPYDCLKGQDGPPGAIEHSQHSSQHSSQHRSPLHTSSNKSSNGNSRVAIRATDVVMILPDDGTSWETSSQYWYAYVLRVRGAGQEQELDVLWLYEPCQTTIKKAYYPFDNELFLSDNCNCGPEAIDAQRVVEKVDIEWAIHGSRRIAGSQFDPSRHLGLFVRQKFRTVHEDDTYDFSALQKDDFRCIHSDGASSTSREADYTRCKEQYQVGDNVLFRDQLDVGGPDTLQPGQIVRFEKIQVNKSKAGRVILRRFARRNLTDPSAPPNELLITDEVIVRPPGKIVRKCHTRLFNESVIREGLPTPYHFGGAGDYFFIRANNPNLPSRGVKFPETNPFAKVLDLAAEDSEHKIPNQMRGLGMFCGGGNFDRGLEDGGAVKFRYAIDWSKQAVHSYRANLNEPEKVHVLHVSVNDFLAEAINDTDDITIAKPGQFDVLAGGSPCPGFSNMQQDKNSIASQRNASMVASVVSFVDFYSPRYCFLENVVTMTASMGAGKNENVFGQIIASLVALGYQVQQFYMGSWSYGSPQRRARVFIIASVPGTTLLPPMHYTHDHPPEAFRSKSLGRSSSGLQFGMKRDDVTPFSHVSPSEATKDLPDIGDGQAQICPAFPDHRTPGEESFAMRNLIAAIPIHPPGMTLVKAAHAGRLPKRALEKFEKMRANKKTLNNRSYGRIPTNGLFPTVLTANPIACSRSGTILHWREHRAVTIMELRRAQGFLDHEVIVGRPHQQVHIIGNSVDRKVSFALGLGLRQSVIQSRRHESHSVNSIEKINDDSIPFLSQAPKKQQFSSASAASLSLDGIGQSKGSLGHHFVKTNGILQTLGLDNRVPIHDEPNEDYHFDLPIVQRSSQS